MLTLGTVAILAGMIAVLGGVTQLTGVEMTAANGRATAANISHHPAVAGEEFICVGSLVSWPILLENPSQFYHGVGPVSATKSAISWSITATALD